MSDDKAFIRKFCSEVWWLVLLRGIASLVLGGLLIAKPGVTAIVMVQFLGAYFLVDGVFSVINSVMGRKHMQGWGWGLVMGGLEILTGILVFGHPIASTIITANTLVYCVAFLAIVFGVLGITTGIQVRKEVEGEWAMIAGGVLAIIFGVMLIMNPLASAAVYLTVMGVMAVLGGIVQIFASFQIRKIGTKGPETAME
jgi:uncharacterized membrane protein HdeD (DUF308 family)